MEACCRDMAGVLCHSRAGFGCEERRQRMRGGMELGCAPATASPALCPRRVHILSARRPSCLSARAQALPLARGPTNGAAAASVPIKGDPLQPVNGVHGSSDSMASPIQGQQTGQLVLMRHGESMWNDLKLFTGDADIPLTEKGVMEAIAGGKAVQEVDFDIIFTSRLVRSKQTALIAMTQSHFQRVPVLVRGGYYGKGQTGDANRLRLRDAAAKALEHASCRMIPVYADPALNERCYGDLQGLSKEAAIREFGEETVTKWRRSYDTRPPNGESLQDTYKRAVQFFLQTVQPRLKEGQNVMVVAHGNVLRCIMAYISGLTDQEMLVLQIVTAMSYAYALHGDSFVECCVLPPIDPETKKRREWPMGMTSSLQKGAIDSLI